MTVSRPAPASDWLIDLWTSDDNLPDSSVTSLAQTPDGYLWIGTLNGLARFDGTRFASFTPSNTPALKHSQISGLFLDDAGTLWINTHDGSLTAYRHGRFHPEWTGGQVATLFSISNRVYFALKRGALVSAQRIENAYTNWQMIPLPGSATGTAFHEDNHGNLWCLLRNGSVERIIGTNCEPVARPPAAATHRPRFLATAPDGRILLGMTDGILGWNGYEFVDETPTNGPPHPSVSYLFCATNGTWAFADGKVRKFVGRRWTEEVPEWNDLAAASPTYLGAQQDHRGYVWFRQFGLGVFYATPDGSVGRLAATNGLPGDRINCWLQDLDGNVWLGIDHGGLVRLRERQFKAITSAGSISSIAVSSVCEDPAGDLWLGTFNAGLIRWRNGQSQHFELGAGANHTSFFSVCPDSHDQLWMSAGREDLFLLRSNQIVPATPSLHGVKTILADHGGRVWFGRQSRLTCLETNGTMTSYGTQNGFPRTDVRALAEDSAGRIWIGTGDGNLLKFEKGKFVSSNTQSALDGQAIWALLAEADGTVWIGSSRGGLLRFNDGKLTRYSTADGLPDNVICQILDDGLGHLWIGSHKGIFYLNKDALKAFDAGLITSIPCVSFGVSDGLPSLECSGGYQPSCWRARDGTLWFATVKGAVAVDPRRLFVNRRPPPIVIEELQVDGRTLTDLQPDQPLQIPPGRHRFLFRYTALSFTAPEKTRFRYRLRGMENNWVDANTKHFAQYGLLPPGNYEFQATACNNYGIWSDPGASVRFRVLPAVWQTWWFQTIAGVIVLAAIFSFGRFLAMRRMQQKLEQFHRQRALEHERERIARDIHDELGAGLTQIMLQSSLARSAPAGQMQADLANISDAARQLVRAMDETVWAINPENDTLDGLATYVAKYAQEFAASAGLRCRLNFPAELPAVTLSAETRHHLFLVVKEALNNTVKHAAATELSLQLKLCDHGFSLIIKDNGSGFDPSAPGQSDPLRAAPGNGLTNIRERMAGIGGSCEIVSAPGKGTEVNLTFIVPKKKSK